jgi:sugar O-acyltransferase (sialic acid O-acetyltransferase NeuD family)
VAGERVAAAKKKLIVISAGKFGREVRDIARDIERSLSADCPWEFAGFLDDREHLLVGKAAAAGRVLGDPLSYEPGEHDVFICAIGSPAVRRHYAGIVRGRGGRFTTLIEPWSRVGERVEIGTGCLIGPFCVVSCDLKIGDDTVITTHVTIGHDAVIGCGCHIGAFAFIGGGVELSDEVTVHPHAMIAPGVQVGRGAVIGAGAVVLTDVVAGHTVFGSPARSVGR